jgi:hypothetical protein
MPLFGGKIINTHFPDIILVDFDALFLGVCCPHFGFGQKYFRLFMMISAFFLWIGKSLNF